MAHCVCGPYNLGSYRGLKLQVVENFGKKLRFGRKRTLAGTFSKFCSERIHQDSPIHVLCVNFVEFGRPKIGKVVRHLPDKKSKTSPRSLFCANRAQNVPGPAADNVLRAPQISSKSVHLRRRHSRTREHRRNAPQSISNIRPKPIFELNKNVNKTTNAVVIRVKYIINGSNIGLYMQYFTLAICKEVQNYYLQRTCILKLSRK